MRCHDSEITTVQGRIWNPIMKLAGRTYVPMRQSMELKPTDHSSVLSCFFFGKRQASDIVLRCFCHEGTLARLLLALMQHMRQIVGHAEIFVDSHRHFGWHADDLRRSPSRMYTKQKKSQKSTPHCQHQHPPMGRALKEVCTAKIAQNNKKMSNLKDSKEKASSQLVKSSEFETDRKLTTEQLQQLDEVVSKVVSEVCMITLLKVLDNIIEEKDFNPKTRRFKLTNPTFQKRITSHPGGLDVLYLSGFDDKRPVASTAAVSSNHSVVSSTSTTATTTTVLELFQEKEDKEWLWHVRQALYQHGQGTLRLTKLPPMPPAPITKAPRKTSLSSIISNCSSQRTEMAHNSIGHGQGGNNREETDGEDEKKQEGWDLQWESTNNNSSHSRRPLDRDEHVSSEGHDVTVTRKQLASQSTAHELEPEPQVVESTAAPLLMHGVDVNESEISVTTAPLNQDDEDGDGSTSTKHAPTIQRAASWKSKLDEFLANLDTEKQDGGTNMEGDKVNKEEKQSSEFTGEHLAQSVQEPTESKAENTVVDENNLVQDNYTHPSIHPTLPPTKETTITTSALDLILADVDDASPLRLSSDTRKQMGIFLMDAHARRPTKAATSHAGANHKAMSAAQSSRKVPSLQEIVDGRDSGDNLKNIFDDMNTTSKSPSAVDKDSGSSYQAILAEIDVVLSNDSNTLPSNSAFALEETSTGEIELPDENKVESTVDVAATTVTDDINSATPPSPPSSAKPTNVGCWSPKIDSDRQTQYMNMLHENLSSVVPEKAKEEHTPVQDDEAATTIPHESAFTTSSKTRDKDDDDEWKTLCTVMKNCSLSAEFEPCWGALCKLSEICSHLVPPFAVLQSKPVDTSDSTKHTATSVHTLRSWIPTDLVIALWEIVMKDEGVNPARTEYVMAQLRQVLLGEHKFLEELEGEELPHTRWWQIPSENLIRAGTSLPDLGPNAEVWLLHLCDFLLVDASSWYGRYAVLEIFGRSISDSAKSERVESLLNSIDFIQSRLDVLGLEQGTTRHIQDCKNYIDNLLRHDFLKQDANEAPVAVATEEMGLAVGQHIATCLYRSAQLLEKADVSPAIKAEKLAMANALHQLGMAAGDWRDYDFEMQLYGRTLVIRREVCDAGSEEIADTLLVIGACHQSQANLGAAMSCYEEALDMFKARLGEHHDKVAEALHNMGVVHCERSELDAAMGNLKSSFKIRQDNHDSKNFNADMSDTLCWIGKVYREQGQLQKAYKYFATACASKEEIAGKDSLDVAEILHNIAVIHDDQGEFDVSLEFYTKSLEIKRRRLGEDHEDVCELLTCIGHVYLLMGEDSKALKVFRRVLEKRTNMKPRNSSKSQTQMLLQTYADVIDILRDQSSRATESRSVKDYLAATLLEMGQLYEGVGEYEKCLACLDECLTVSKLECFLQSERQLELIDSLFRRLHRY